MYWFLRSFITNYHKLVGSKQQKKFFFLNSPQGWVQKSRYCQRRFPLEVLRENPSHASLLASLQCFMFLALGLQNSYPCLHLHVAFLCISVSSPFLLLTRTVIIRLRAMQENQVRSLGWDDPLEKGMVTHSNILAWRISWTDKPGGLQSTASQRVGHDWVTNAFTF